jgi:hypothetical protein
LKNRILKVTLLASGSIMGITEVRAHLSEVRESPTLPVCKVREIAGFALALPDASRPLLQRETNIEEKKQQRAEERRNQVLKGVTHRNGIIRW